MKSFFTRAAFTAAILVLPASDVLAVPAFARRYEVKCSFCHDVFPKLNRQGERFKERGFRLETAETFDSSAWIRSAPVSGRIIGTRNMPEGRDARNLGYLKVLSAGSLGQRFSYWFDDAWLRTSGSTTHIKPDNAWARVDFKANGKLYAKAGRFEMDLPFSQTHMPHLLPYAIYGVNTGLETDSIGAYQEGLELGGEFGTTHVSAALVKGRNNAAVVELAKQSGVGDPGRFDGNLFLRASRRTATARFGAFAYIGRNDLVARLNASSVGVARDNLLRIGADASVRFSKFHVYGLGLFGRNSNSLLSAAKPTGTGESLNLKGGFVSVDYHPYEAVTLTARYQTRAVDLAGGNGTNTVHSFLPGVQLVVWKLKVSGQSNFSSNNVARFSALQIETAF